MKLRFPLYAKILLWFFLNLLLLGAVLYGFVRGQYHLGLDSLMAGQAGNRIDAVNNLVTAELRETPRETWDGVLERFGEAYGVEFFIFRANGTEVAGAKIDLPQPVRLRLGELRGPAGGEPGPRARERLRDRLSAWDSSRIMEPPPPPPRPHPKFMVRTDQPVRYWVGTRLPLGRRSAPFIPGEVLTLVAMSEKLSGDGLFFDITPWISVGFGAVALSLLFWLPLVRGITRSLTQLTRATERVAEGDFDIRVDASRRDELGRLGQAVNRMAARLAGFVQGQKRFLGDVSHELCSPLARMEVGLSILEQRAGAELHPCIADVREETQQMTELVNELLSFSKAGLHGKETRLTPVNLAELVGAAAARESGKTESSSSKVEIDIPAELEVLAEPGLLSRAVANLIRNALRYAGNAGPILVRAETSEHQSVLLSVADSGPGVPEEHLARLFDPFFRLDTSRSRDTGGVGLGLAIVKTCVEACGGTVAARNRRPSGLTVEIALKRAKPCR